MNDSAMELLKEKRVKTQESAEEEKGTTTTQVKLEGNVLFFVAVPSFIGCPLTHRHVVMSFVFRKMMLKTLQIAFSHHHQ